VEAAQRAASTKTINTSRTTPAFAYRVLGQAGYCPRKCFAPTGVVLFGAIATFGLVFQ
jgi:hypothetical protein